MGEGHGLTWGCFFPLLNLLGECCQFSFISIILIAAMAKKPPNISVTSQPEFYYTAARNYCTVSFQHHLAEFKAVKDGVTVLYKREVGHFMISVLF